MRLQHRIFHMEDAHALQPRATGAAGAAAALGVAAAIALLAWSPILTTLADDDSPAAAALEQSADDTYGAFVTGPLFSQNSWYPTRMPAPAHQPSALLAAFPGPYSPLVVNPPAHRSMRTVSTEYVSID